MNKSINKVISSAVHPIEPCPCCDRSATLATKLWQARLGLGLPLSCAHREFSDGDFDISAIFFFPDCLDWSEGKEGPRRAATEAERKRVATKATMDPSSMDPEMMKLAMEQMKNMVSASSSTKLVGPRLRSPALTWCRRFSFCLSVRRLLSSWKR